MTGGCPQGSILVVFVFNIATDELEEGSDYVAPVGRPSPRWEEEEEQDSFYNAVPDTSNPDRPDLWAPDEDGNNQSNSMASDTSFFSARSSLGPGDDDALASTPAADHTSFVFSASPINMPGIGLRLDSSDVDLRPARRRIIYSSEEDLTPPHEPTNTCLGPWKARRVEVNKYVDDNIQEESVNFENAERRILQGEETRIKQAIPTQNVFRHVIREAQSRGMKVNTSKTGMLCISDSLSYKPSAFILDSDGQRIESGQRLKVLGWHFSSRPTVEAHIGVMKRRFRERYWVLRHLKHNGFTTQDLLSVYTSVVRLSLIHI